MSDVSETVAAIHGAKDAAPDLPVIATMSFDTRGHTMMGVTPERAAEALLEAGRGGGRRQLRQRAGGARAACIEKMRAAFPDAVLVAKGNVGMPQLVGMAVRYETTPETMAELRAPLPGRRRRT